MSLNPGRAGRHETITQAASLCTPEKGQIPMSEGNGAATYAPDIKELGDKIVALTVGKAVELGDYLEKVHNIKPAAGGVAVMAGPGPGGPAPTEKPAEQTAFIVQLDSLADPA